MLWGMTQKQLAEYLHYCPETGRITRLKHREARRCGVDATTAAKQGKYRRVTINYKEVFAHTVAWFLVHGEVCKNLDHVNRNGLDNRLVNLRPATQTQQGANRVNVGVRRTKHGRYEVRISIAGKRTSYGSYATKEEAISAYRKNHSQLHGEFSPYTGAQ